MDVKDKVAIVTGGANGIGCACVRGLLENGAKHVAVFDITTESSGICKLEQDFWKTRIEFYKCDVSNEEDFKSNFEKIIEKQKHVDILINSAGVGNENDAARMIDINVKGTIIGNLIAIEYMGKHKGGKGGVIINVASVTGLLDSHVLPVFSASKHAIVSFTRSMKKNCAKIGVRILAVCPGHTKTEFDEEMSKKKSKNFLDFVAKEDIQQLHQFRVQSPKNVSDAVIQLIAEAEPGTVWVVENDETSFKISSLDHFTKRIIDSHEASVTFCG